GCRRRRAADALRRMIDVGGKEIVGHGHGRGGRERGAGDLTDRGRQRRLKVRRGGGGRGANGELVGSGRRGTGRRQRQIGGGAVRQVEGQLERVAGIGITGRHIDGDARRHAGGAGDDRVRQGRGGARELEAERRSRGVLAN